MVEMSTKTSTSKASTNASSTSEVPGKIMKKSSGSLVRSSSVDDKSSKSSRNNSSSSVDRKQSKESSSSFPAKSPSKKSVAPSSAGNTSPKRTSIAGKRKRISETSNHVESSEGIKDKVVRNRSDKLATVLGNSSEVKKRRSKVIEDDGDEESIPQPAITKVDDTYSSIVRQSGASKEVKHHQRKKTQNTIKKHFISVDRPESDDEFPDSDIQSQETLVIFSQAKYLQTISQIIKDKKKL